MSIIANAMLVSLVYAWRDDDEDETYPEKYLQSLVSETLEGFNPLEYLPILRDVVSLFKGYDILILKEIISHSPSGEYFTFLRKL